MWDLIVSVPDHCLSFYFLLKLSVLYVSKLFKQKFPVSRYCVVIFIVSGHLGLLDSDIRKQNTAKAGARGSEGCCIFQYTVKPNLCFPACRFIVFPKDPHLDYLLAVSIVLNVLTICYTGK